MVVIVFEKLDNKKDRSTIAEGNIGDADPDTTTESTPLLTESSLRKGAHAAVGGAGKKAALAQTQVSLLPESDAEEAPTATDSAMSYMLPRQAESRSSWRRLWARRKILPRVPPVVIAAVAFAAIAVPNFCWFGLYAAVLCHLRC